MLDVYYNLRFDVSEEIDIETLSDELKFCLGYWQNLQTEAGLPSWDDFDLLGLPGQIIPLVTVVDIDWSKGETIDAEALTYRFWGTGHVKAKNQERTGEKVSEHSDRSSLVASEYLKVIEQKHPIAFRKHIRINKPSEAVTQVTLRLPLSYDGQRVDNVLSVSQWTAIDLG